MKLCKSDFTGTGKVFSFTLIQFAKSPGSIVSLVIMLLFSLLSMPMISLFSGTAGEASTEDSPADSLLTAVHIVNETGLELDFADYPGITFVASPAASAVSLSDTEVLVHLYADENGFQADGSASADTQLTEAEVFHASQAAVELLNRARFRWLGISEEQMALLNAGVVTESAEMEEYLTEDTLGFDGRFAIQYAYAIVVMILCLLSSTYIIRAIIEERASKLVELLMVSVKPLALILGKILAMMVYVFGMILLMLVGFILSSQLNTAIFGQSADIFAVFGLSLESLDLGWTTILIALISLLLSYLTFSIIAGIAGTGCSTMEDMESANMSVVLIVMAGYMVSCIVGAIPDSAVATVTAMIPIVSAFCAPVSFVTGTIGWGGLILSWIIQTGVVIFLALFCAKIYDQLILFRGRRVKLKDLLTMAKYSSKKEEN